MELDNDILQEIPFEDIYKLRDLYSEHLPYATHVYSTLNTAIKWTKARPDKKYFTFFAPNGDWKTHGTFIALLQWSCYDLFMFTLDRNCEQLYKSLVETKKINWDNEVLFYALHKDHREAVLKAMNDRKVPMDHETKTDYWWMPKEKAAALTFECPDEFYIKTLSPEDAHTIDELWPHRYEGSVNYVSTFIEMNGGHGVFTKAEDRLVSWVLKNQMGTLGLLQTVDEFKRKGLGALITKSLSKEIALEGHNPVGTVLINNAASQNMFTKLGFEILDWCSFIGAGKERQ